MKYTTNYNLYKPDYDDTIDVDFLNKNMDVLDTQINGLDYVQNVNTSDNGLTFIKRNGDTIPVSLNYLPITGGTVTGGTEFTGVLTNNGKDVGRLFCNKSPILTPLIDFDKMATVRGNTEKTTVSTIRNGVSTNVTYYNWCLFNSNYSVVYFEKGDIYLKESFKNFDKLIILSLTSNAVNYVKYNVIDCGELEWAMNNLSSVVITGASAHGQGMWVVRPYKAWGTQTKTSTDTLFTLDLESTDMVEIYGVKYARD